MLVLGDVVNYNTISHASAFWDALGKQHSGRRYRLYYQSVDSDVRIVLRLVREAGEDMPGRDKESHGPAGHVGPLQQREVVVTHSFAVTARNSSERVFERKLDRPRKTSGDEPDIGDRAGIHDSKHAAVGPDTRWLVVMFGIERVLHLRTELDGLPLRDVRNLAEAQVHVAVAGEPEEVSPEIGKLSGSRGREQGDL